MKVTGKIQRNNDRFFKSREKEREKMLYKNKVKIKSRPTPVCVCVGGHGFIKRTFQIQLFQFLEQIRI